MLEAERQLRGLLGLPIEDGTRLVPSDTPTLAPYQPDWDVGRERGAGPAAGADPGPPGPQVRQLDLIIQKNLLLPDLRFFATYDINGLGTRLDGGPTGSRVRPATATPSTSRATPCPAWPTTTSTLADRPAAGRAARLPRRPRRGPHGPAEPGPQLLPAQGPGDKAQRFLALQYRNVCRSTTSRSRPSRPSARRTPRQLEGPLQAFQAGRGTLDILLEAQRNWADALANEYTAIVKYNNTLAGFEFAKGTILQHNNVVIAEGPLPLCAQVRAVEHIREREKALMLRERPDPAVYEPQIRGDCPPRPTPRRTW